MVCRNCPRRERCSRICPEVEKLLPSMDAGRLNHGRLKKEELLRMIREIVSTRRMIAARDRLSGRQREVFDLYYNEGLTQREIAKRLGIAQKNVCTYMQRARRTIARSAPEDAPAS